jgi:hypothetical protein
MALQCGKLALSACASSAHPADQLLEFVMRTREVKVVAACAAAVPESPSSSSCSSAAKALHRAESGPAQPATCHTLPGVLVATYTKATAGQRAVGCRRLIRHRRAKMLLNVCTRLCRVSLVTGRDNLQLAVDAVERLGVELQAPVTQLLDVVQGEVLWRNQLAVA